MATKNVKEESKKEVKNTEVLENTEVKEGLLTKAKTKVKGINLKTAGKVVVFGVITGAIGYAFGNKSSGSDENYYDSSDFTTDSNSNDIIDITEF